MSLRQVLTKVVKPEPQRHLPKILRAGEAWCQGDSEPGSGSERASLKTQAIRQGDKYIGSGQHIWTSRAPCAGWIFCPVHTSVAASRQQGVCFLLIDMNSKGAQVRPIRTIYGHHPLHKAFGVIEALDMGRYSGQLTAFGTRFGDRDDRLARFQRPCAGESAVTP